LFAGEQTSFGNADILVVLASNGKTMKRPTLTAVAAAISLAFSAGAIAQGMSKAEHKATKEKIESEYKSAKAGCAPLLANANDICMAQATGRKNVALAELAAAYKPGEQARYDVRIAKADADYSVASERCDDRAGNAKDVCLKEAKAVQTAAKADAKAQMKTADANKAANEKSEKARGQADKKIGVARKDAAAEKRDAEYAVAKEKCDALAGNAKDACVANAKARHGK
jgi:hypothetical protein